MINSASDAKARAITALCLCPPDSLATSVFSTSFKSTISIALSTTASIFFRLGKNMFRLEIEPNFTSSRTVIRKLLGIFDAA